VSGLLGDPQRLGDATMTVGVPLTVLLLVLLLVRDVVAVSGRLGRGHRLLLDAVLLVLVAAFVALLALRFTALV
jgi:hypothetical protein